MKGLTHLSLFSGIGGFDLATEWAGFRTIGQVEKNPYRQKVLRKHWPHVPMWEDIRDVTEESLKEARIQTVTLVTGGFPCQSFSVAGKRRGKADDRYLWPEMFRVIKLLRPHWVLAENVTGIVRMALDTVLSDLESEGYSVQAFIIPACGTDAPHRRDRVWIVGSLPSIIQGRSEYQDLEGRQTRTQAGGGSSDVSNPQHKGLEGAISRKLENEGERGFDSNPARPDWWESEPDVGRVAHGVPHRVDRLAALGDAIVPQVAYRILRAIAEIERMLWTKSAKKSEAR